MTYKAETAESKRPRPGRRSRLDSFRVPSGPIDPPSDEFRNNLQWFERCGGFIVRDSCGDDTCATDLEVNAELAQQLRENLVNVSKTSVCDHFVPYPGSKKNIPPFPVEEDYWKAISISKALMNTAMKKQEFARAAVSAYACGVRPSDKLMVLSKPEHAQFGRALIDLVRLMDLKFLRWQIVGFKKDGDLPKFVPKRWCDLLKLPSNTPMHWIAAKNPSHLASKNAIAIRVTERRGRSAEFSGTFHSVMLVAYVVKMWGLSSSNG